MPALAFLIPLLRSAGGLLIQFASSHIGQLVIVAASAWFISGHRERAVCAARETARIVEMQRVHDAEVAREVKAGQEIALEATRRSVEDAKAASEMQAEIDKESDNVQDGNCAVDESLADRVRKLDSHDRETAPAKRARRVR